MKNLPFSFIHFSQRAVLLCAATCLSFSAHNVRAAAFGQGNLVVVLDGTVGAPALSSAATAASLWEYTTSGAFVQSIALPTAPSGANQAVTLSGSATSEGFLTLSANGQYLTMAGYATAPGTAGVTTAAAGTINRVVARIDMNGNVDSSTSLSDAYSGSNIRSAVSSDGNTIWTGGNAGSGLGATSGVRSTTLGNTTSTQVNPTTGNIRVVNIFNGQLYASSSSGTFLGISTVGTGEPTALGSGSLTLLPGMPTTGTHSSYDFLFSDPNTLYVADDGGAAAGGGIQKWILSGGTWTLAYTLLNNGTTTTGVRGLTGFLDGSGNFELFGTTTAGNANTLIEVTDTGAGALATILATAGANTAFRGVEYIPAVPEPTSFALLGLGLLGLRAVRRKH